MSETYKLQVDTGVIDVPVYDKDKQIGTITFNPTDVGIIDRYETAVENIEKLNEKTELSEIEAGLIEQFDYIFKSETKSTLFCNVSPITVMANGDFFFETILEGVGGIVEKATEKRIKKKKARIDKALAKYHK